LVKSKGKANALRTTQKSTIWDTTSSLVILDAIFKYTKEFQDQQV